MHGQIQEVHLQRKYRSSDRARKRRVRRMKRRMIMMAFMLANLLLFVLLIVGIRHLIFVEKTESATAAGSSSVAPWEEEAQMPSVEQPTETIPDADAAKLVMIDPGHGGADDGCSRDGVTESELNLAIAEYLGEALIEKGMDVMFTRQDNDTSMTLKERTQLAADNKADIFVSIHQNACPEEESSVHGMEVWYCPSSDNSFKLAELIQQYVIKKTNAEKRTLQDGSSLYVVKKTAMPACLIETGFLSNTEEREKLKDTSYQKKIAEGIAEGIYYYFYPKTMYLTFDDGPSAENTVTVLDILKERNIKATFFLVGENVKKHPDVAKRIAEEGHTIGIHCNTHDYKKLYKSKESFYNDFRNAYEAIYEATGVEAKLFRFPGGSINSYNKDVYADIIEEMTRLGFLYFDWNASLEDAVSKSDPKQLVENAKSSTLGRKKVVMLAHDIVYNTTQCLEELLDSFPDYQFEPLTTEVKPIQF